MKRLPVLLALAAVLAGCSGGKDKTTPVVQSSSTDCGFKEITTGPRREGTCVAQGVNITVANKAHWLHGKDYSARIIRTRVQDDMLIVDLAVRNTLEAPRMFNDQSNLVFALVDGKYFGESREAEPAQLRPVPFRHRTEPIQPGKVATGTVAFRIPAEHLEHLTNQGSNLILVNYGDADKQFPTGTQRLDALGYIRLWK